MGTFLDQRKLAKIIWLQDTNQSKVDDPSNVRREASRQMSNKKKENLKAEIDELETNSNIENIKYCYKRISNFKIGYYPRSNIVKDEKGDLGTYSHSTLVRWRNHFP
jgi:hypothetical protein